MPGRLLVLASASPARLGLLRQAGFDPQVVVSGVDEDDHGQESPVVIVQALAQAKAAAVAARPEVDGSVVVGCDSLFEFEGEVWGKPGSADTATARIRAMRGHSGLLHTGHAVIDTVTGASAGKVATTLVRFAPMTDAEVDAYVATGEPIGVAGSFTLDGRASVFVEGIEGDPSNVIGLSLPLFRALLAELGIGVTELWT